QAQRLRRAARDAGGRVVRQHQGDHADGSRAGPRRGRRILARRRRLHHEALQPAGAARAHRRASEQAVIAAAAILALLQIVAISATARAWIAPRLVLTRAELRRELLLGRLREPVLELVALEDESPPQALEGLRTTAEREAVGELLARYAGDVRGASRERIAR